MAVLNPAARAGGWDVIIQRTGNHNTAGGVETGTFSLAQTTTGSFSSTTSTNSVYGSISTYNSSFGSNTARTTIWSDVDCIVKIKMIWRRNSGEPPSVMPPPFVTVKVKTSIRSTAKFAGYEASNARRLFGVLESGFPDDPRSSYINSQTGITEQQRLNNDHPYQPPPAQWHLLTRATEGESVEFTFPMKGRVELSFDGYDQGRYGKVGINGDTALTLDNRSVQISSGSFFDSAGKNWRNESGQRLVNWRKGDGAQVVDSVVSWNGFSWMGGIPSHHTFNASAQNFTNPFHTWTLTGDGQTSGIAPSGAQATSWALNGLNRINLGNTPDISQVGPGVNGPFGKSSAVKLQVKDTDNAVGENTFTVRWHHKAENWTQRRDPIATYTSIPATLTNDDSSKVPTSTVGEALDVIIEPSPWRCDLLLSPTEQTIVWTGTAIITKSLTSWFTGAGELIKLKEYGAWAFGGMQTGVLNEGAAQNEREVCTNNADLFFDAVNSTIKARQGIEGHDIRIFPDTLVTQPGIWTTHSAFEMTPHIKRKSTKYFYKGDAYNHTGYLGEATGDWDGVDKADVVGEFHLIGTTPS